MRVGNYDDGPYNMSIEPGDLIAHYEPSTGAMTTHMSRPAGR
ncbi:MAG TPA: hypothetical protein VFE45_04195 [Coriobacteriia bacterium]|nr:hypothetical protein [Coriobacteriia bacterium]